MNNKVKQLWVRALKSGKFKQGTGKLCYGNQSGTYHCCLGVLSELAVEAGVCSRRTAFNGNNVLNPEVTEWAELPSSNPSIGINCAVVLNDDLKLSFNEIADKINKYL